MKRKFVKPEISNYSLQSAVGQDSIQGFCEQGSFPQAAGGPGGLHRCSAGFRPDEDNFCVGGGTPTVGVCNTGLGVSHQNRCERGDSA